MKNRALGAAKQPTQAWCSMSQGPTLQKRKLRPRRYRRREWGADRGLALPRLQAPPPVCPMVCGVQDSVSLRLCPGPAAGGPSRLMPTGQ